MAVAAVGLLAGSVASACGGNDDGPTPATPSEVATVTPTAAATATPTPVATPVATATPTATARATATPTPAATATATPAATPTATEPTPAPTPTPQPIPLDLPEVTFWGDVSDDQQAMSRARVADIVEFFAERFGVSVPDLSLHIAGDAEALREALGTEFDSQTAIHQAKYTEGSIYIHATRAPGGIERRYFEAFQDHITEGRDLGPKWLSEAAAVYAGHLFRDWTGERAIEEAVALEQWAASYDKAPLDTFETESPAAASLSGSEGVAIATIAVDWLVGQVGEDALVEYYRALPNSGTWEEAFELTFGLTLADAYAGFAAHRAEVVVERWDVRALVLGPDGEPLQDQRLLVEAISEDESESESDYGRLDGRFTLQVPDGGYWLNVAVDCPAAFEVLGWYEEASGLTTDQGEATLIVVDGEDMEGIVFKLPAVPDELVPECAGDR